MKKSIFTILLISFMLFTIFGCSNTAPPTNTHDDTTTGDVSSAPAFVDVIKDYDTVDESSVDGFVIKSRKYDYKKNNVLLINVENHSNNSCSVTLNVTYFDESGQELSKDSQSFEGFATNWQKYFLFQPNKTFTSYEYTMTTEEFNEECLGNKITFRFDGIKDERTDLGLDESGTPIGIGKGIISYMAYRIEYPDPIYFGCSQIIFDNQGEIYFIETFGAIGNKPAYVDQYITTTLITGTKGSVELPEELNGELNGIVALNRIDTKMLFSTKSSTNHPYSSLCK